MARKISYVAPDPNLATKMRVGRFEAMAKVPPEFALGVARIAAHLTRERALRRRGDGAVEARPHTWLVVAF
jgi:hypothetical protein